MLELLTSEYAILQEMALRTVNNCMLDVNGRNAFREIGGLEKIVQFIANKVHRVMQHIYDIVVLLHNSPLYLRSMQTCTW